MCKISNVLEMLFRFLKMPFRWLCPTRRTPMILWMKSWGSWRCVCVCRMSMHLLLFWTLILIIQFTDIPHFILQNFDLESKEELSDKEEETQDGNTESAWLNANIPFVSVVLLCFSDHGCPLTLLQTSVTTTSRLC